ncbi:SAM dependent carboxyl methyltransferase [Serratia rubidaea]|uniref:SAM dependent carboxyl methyltransferase n=1 Tax=Serratia rubidaea TaxID=61652 RepID=A0A447QV06_SERRU|nr:SAM dependent carboxyl methyltransferase [Serratia rubidaea]
MSSHRLHSQGVMESHGAYNQHAHIQNCGNLMVIPLIEQLLADSALTPTGSPIFLADYGASQGKNSLLPIGAAVKILRQRFPALPIIVAHNDRWNNDFNTLFQVLEQDENRYIDHTAQISYCAIGRSFFVPVLPAGSVLFGLSAYATLWLSQMPPANWDHIIAYKTSDAIRHLLALQASHDWTMFLNARAEELQPGGKLLVVQAGLDDNAESGFCDIMEHAVKVLDTMQREKYFSVAERERMKIGVYMRLAHEILAPFSTDDSSPALAVEHFSTTVLPDPAWQHYVHHGDALMLAQKQSRFFRATFMPSLLSALDARRDNAQRQQINNIFEEKLIARCAAHPAPIEQRAQTLIVVKPSC